MSASVARAVAIYAAICALLGAVTHDMGVARGEGAWPYFIGLVVGTVAMAAAMSLRDHPIDP